MRREDETRELSFAKTPTDAMFEFGPLARRKGGRREAPSERSAEAKLRPDEQKPNRGNPGLPTRDI
jgi:hypothetical protein